MTDTIGIDAPPSVGEGPDLRTLLRDHNSADMEMGKATSEPPQIDISTTTAAVSAAQKAQLQNTATQQDQPQLLTDSEGLTMPLKSSPPVAPLQDIHHSQSPASEASPSHTMSNHGLKLSPLPAEHNPPAQICLCQQPARIPRPRNAFILFRQHHHASVVQANPGKPNPEISKIIGEMWRESSKETKLIWQRHADEEKRQHLARYPEYKYQPRRSGKRGNPSPAGIPGMMESALCSTCGGHTGALNTPDTPATPMSASSMSATPMSATHPLSSVSTRTFRNTYMPTPRTPSASFTQIPPIPKNARRRRKNDESQAGVEALLQIGLSDADETELSPAGSTTQNTQAVKKRRLNVSSPTTIGGVGAPRTPHSSVPLVFGPDVHIDPFLKHSNLQEGSFGGSESPPTLTGEPENTAAFSPILARGNVLTNVSPLSKLQAIARICKPLPAPEISPGASPRGAIIAIEGEDVVAVKSLCDSLADTLKGELVEIVGMDNEAEETCLKEKKSGDHIVKSDKMQGLSGGGFLESEDDRCDEEGVKTAKYLRSVADWRLQSNKMRKKVMPPRRQSDCTGAHSQTSSTITATVNSPEQDRNVSQASGKLPILLLNRYILSRADSAATSLTLDGLTPLQHWQWAASLWTGCVGADMTILVKTDGPTGGDGVEVKDPGKVLVARKDVGKEWDGGRVRRLGFEVNECVRSLMGVNS